MRFVAALVAAFALSACGAPAEDIEAICTELVLNYAYHRDQLDPDATADLFTEDAEMSVLGSVFKGRDAIRQRMIDGRDGPVSRHLMSTIRIFPDSDSTATGVSYVTVYAAPRADEDGPLPVEGFLGIGEYRDRFEKTSAGWKIASREFVPVFEYRDGN